MRVLLFLLLFIPIVGQSQYTFQDNPNTKRQFRGFIEALEGFRFPVQGGHSIPAGDSLWFVRVNPGDGQLYMWNGLSWGCMTCGGTGIVDSSLFVTLSRLRDSLSRVQSTLDDSIMVVRGLIAAGSADSSVFATLYRLDSVKANIRAESVKYSDTANMLNGYVRVQRFLDSISAVRSFAGTKQNQLNGTGFVKASGTTISYDNTTYVPTSRTITINGTSQDLSANRSWTISSSADSSTFATKYGVDTAKAALRSSINSKQNLITLTTTGTSGAATFNQSTGALNIPNYANTTYTGSTSIVLSGTSFQRAALTGDVTASQNSNSTTIANGAVTNAKMANMATQTFKGRNTAGSGAPEDLSVSTVRSMLSINNVDNTSDANKPISTATQAALNLKIDSVRTSVDSIFVKYNGTWLFAGVISAQGAGVSWGSIGGMLSAQTDLQNALNAKMNYSDTTSLSSRINTKLSISDTSAMLSPYLRKVDTASLSNRINTKMGYSDTVSLSNRINTKLNASDTSSLSNRINAKLSVSDTSSMLSAYLRKVDTASLSTRINAKMGYSDTVSLSNRINAKLNISDTSTMLGSYLRKVDTVSLSNRINLKLNIADTSGMLSPYLRKVDTTGKWLSAGTDVYRWDGDTAGLDAGLGRTSLGGTTVGQALFTLPNPSQTRYIRINADNSVTTRIAADFRADLGGTTVGQSFFTLTNPSAITFPRINANNTVSALSASDFRTAIGAGTGSGTVTSVGLSVPTGFSVSGSPVTTSGTITLSYATGYQGYTSTEASKLSGIEAGADVTDATNVAAAGAIMDGDFSANGLMVRTASGTYTSRTLTGTANQITVTNGNGVSGNPTLSLHSDVTNALGKANTSLQPSDTVSLLFTKSDALIIRKYVDNCTSCTLTVNDHRTILRIANASPVTLYVPTGLQDDFEVLIEQAGAGKITVSALSGVAIGSFESAFTTKGTYATATLYATEEEDEFTLTGNLE